MSELPGPPPPARRVRPPTTGQMLGLVGTLVVFAILGPPIGGLVVIASLAAQIPDATTEGATAVFLAMLIWGWWVSYPLGVIPALAAGVAIGIKRAWGDGAGFVFAAATGIVVGLVWTFGFMETYESEADWDLMPGLLAGSIVATLACWLITGGIGRAARLAKQERPTP